MPGRCCVFAGFLAEHYDPLAVFAFFRAMMPAAICSVAPIAQARKIRIAEIGCAISSRTMLETEIDRCDGSEKRAGRAQ